MSCLYFNCLCYDGGAMSNVKLFRVMCSIQLGWFQTLSTSSMHITCYELLSCLGNLRSLVTTWYDMTVKWRFKSYDDINPNGDSQLRRLMPACFRVEMVRGLPNESEAERMLRLFTAQVVGTLQYFLLKRTAHCSICRSVTVHHNLCFFNDFSLCPFRFDPASLGPSLA